MMVVTTTYDDSPTNLPIYLPTYLPNASNPSRAVCVSSGGTLGEILLIHKLMSKVTMELTFSPL